MTVLWLRAARILAAATVSLFTVFRSSVSAQRVFGRSPQVNTVTGFPGGSSYSSEYSSQFQTFYGGYGGYGSNPSPPRGGNVQYNLPTSQYSGGGGQPLPTLKYLSNSGILISVPGPYEQSEFYKVKFYINVNRPFNGVKQGDYEADVSFPVGTAWTYTFPNIRVKFMDTVYYWVVATGRLGLRTWFKEYNGYTTVSYNPHGNPDTIYTPSNPTPKPVRPLPEDPPFSPPISPPIYEQPQYVPNTPVYRPEPQPKPNPIYPTVRPKPNPTNIGPIDLSNYPIPDKVESCRRTSTVFNNGMAACAGQPLVDRITFEAVSQIAGHEPEEKFTVFSKENLIKNGTVTAFIPSLLEDTYGEEHVDKSISLTDCTSPMPNLCSATANNYFILPPIIGARETTEGTLSFRYGVLEVTAKLPSGDWIVPELWLLPKTPAYGKSSGRIVLARSRGNDRLNAGNKDYSSRTLEAGVEFGNKNRLFTRSQNVPWHSGYHTFKLIWNQDQMIFYVDDREIGRVEPGRSKLDNSLRGSNLAPFDKEFYLAFGIHVGGDKDFPEVPEKPWKKGDLKNKVNFWRDRDNWYRTWHSEDSRMYISMVRLTALDQ